MIICENEKLLFSFSNKCNKNEIKSDFAAAVYLFLDYLV